MGKNLNSRELSVKDILFHLKISHLWSILIGIAGIIGGASYLGSMYSSIKSDAIISALQTEHTNTVSELRKIENDLRSELADYKNKSASEKLTSQEEVFRLEREIDRLKDEKTNETSSLQEKIVKISELNNELNQKLDAQEKRYRGLETKERIMSLYVRYLLAKAEGTEEREYFSAREALDKALTDAWESYMKSPATADVEVRGIVVGKGGLSEKATIKFIYDNTIWPIPSDFRTAVKK